MELGINEIGCTICQKPDGSLVLGPVSVGSPHEVHVEIACPPGARVVGLHHTHPRGIAYPSETDIQMALDTGIKNICITDDTMTGCFVIERPATAPRGHDHPPLGNGIKASGQVRRVGHRCPVVRRHVIVRPSGKAEAREASHAKE